MNLIAEQTRSTGDRSGSVAGKVNVGCAADTHCHVAVPVAFDHPGAGSTRWGPVGLELGVKYRVLDSADTGWSAAIYPTVDLPTGDASRGLGADRALWLLLLWV